MSFAIVDCFRTVFELLAILLLFRITLISSSCPNFTVSYDGTNQVELVNCTLYNTSFCNNLLYNLTNNLSSGSSVSKPRDFNVNFYYDLYNGKQYPGFIFTWKAAREQISRENTKGYYLSLHQLPDIKTICRVIDFEGSPPTNAATSFQFKLWPAAKSSEVTFYVRLISLPPPLELDQETYADFIISVPAVPDQSVVENPYLWTTWVRVDINPSGGSVNVSFGFANASIYRFDTYNIYMYIDGNNNIYKNGTVYNTVTSTDIGHYTFNDIPAGNYTVGVQPKEISPISTSTCLCYRYAEMAGKSCDACSFSRTEVFSVPGAVLTTSLVPTSQAASTGFKTTTTSTETIVRTSQDASTGFKTTTTSTETIVEPPQDSTGTIKIAVTLSVVIAIIIIIFVLLMLWRRGGGTCEKVKEKVLPQKALVNKPQPTSEIGNGFIPPRAGARERKIPNLTRLQVFVLAADDHHYHTHAVEEFVNFLRAHCLCDVDFAVQCAQEMRGLVSYCWLSQKMDQADLIIIVNSEAAYNLYEAYRTGRSYSEAELGPEGDLFTPGIQHICGLITTSHSPVDLAKVLMVYFTHTISTFRLPIPALPSQFYRLPDHMTDLVKHMHSLDDQTMDLTHVNLPLCGNIAQFLEGGPWINAIEAARIYERKNPDWFDIKFKRMCTTRPLINKLDSGIESDNGSIISDMSAYGGFPSSVSMIIEQKLMYPETDHRDFTQNDFIEPSLAYTVVTVPPPCGEEGNIPYELDIHSTVTEQMRKHNENYERDRLSEIEKLKIRSPDADELDQIDEGLSMSSEDFRQFQQQINAHYEEDRLLEMENGEIRFLLDKGHDSIQQLEHYHMFEAESTCKEGCMRNFLAAAADPSGGMEHYPSEQQLIGWCSLCVRKCCQTVIEANGRGITLLTEGPKGDHCQIHCC